MALELHIQQWRAGELRLADADPSQRDALERVTEALLAELRRRLGGPYSASELAALYEAGTAWCTDIAYKVAPGLPAAWDPRLTADAAFGRYFRGASDYAGGRALPGD